MTTPDHITHPFNFKPSVKRRHQEVVMEALGTYVRFLNLFDDELQTKVSEFFNTDFRAFVKIQGSVNTTNGSILIVDLYNGDDGGPATLTINWDIYSKHNGEDETHIDSIVQIFDTYATLVYDNGVLDPEGRASSRTHLNTCITRPSSDSPRA